MPAVHSWVERCQRGEALAQATPAHLRPVRAGVASGRALRQASAATDAAMRSRLCLVETPALLFVKELLQPGALIGAVYPGVGADGIEPSTSRV
jgi:hypothetical protein